MKKTLVCQLQPCTLCSAADSYGHNSLCEVDNKR